MRRNLSTRIAAVLGILIVCVVSSGQEYNIQFRPRVAAGQSFTDDFSTDPFSSRWTKDQVGVGSITWQSGTEDVDIDTGSGTKSEMLMRYNTAVDTAEQCVCGDTTASSDPDGGPLAILRSGSDAAVGLVPVVYTFHNNSSSTTQLWYSLLDNGAFLCDVASDVISETVPYDMCVQMSGTGAWNDASPGSSGNKVRVWFDPASRDCTGTPDIGYTDWDDESGTCYTSARATTIDAQRYIGWGMWKRQPSQGNFTTDDWVGKDM